MDWPNNPPPGFVWSAATWPRASRAAQGLPKTGDAAAHRRVFRCFTMKSTRQNGHRWQGLSLLAAAFDSES
jgi:hypothetical protein